MREFDDLEATERLRHALVDMRMRRLVTTVVRGVEPTTDVEAVMAAAEADLDLRFERLRSMPQSIA